jgi:hypothetical protein
MSESTSHRYQYTCAYVRTNKELGLCELKGPRGLKKRVEAYCTTPVLRPCETVFRGTRLGANGQRIHVFALLHSGRRHTWFLCLAIGSWSIQKK